MTNVTHTVQALLVAAAEQIVKANREHKKATGEALYKLGDDIGNGITYRELNSWLNDFKAKQKAAGATPVKATETKPAPKATETKPALKAAPAPAAAELKSGAIREAGELAIGRNKEKVLRISNIAGVRTVVTDKGSKIAVADLEFNNRGNLRVKLDLIEKYTAAPATKAPAKAPAVEQEDFPAEVPANVKPAAKAATKAPAKAPAEPEGKVFPVRDLKIKTSAQLTAAQYDRNTKTLTVTLKDKAVWAYEGLALKDVRAFEQAAQPWKHFSAHIASQFKGKMVKNHGTEAKAAATETKPAAKAPAKAPAAKTAAAPAITISTTRLRAEGFKDGRTTEQVNSIMKNKETGERIVVTNSGKRIPLAAIIEVKGKFRVSDLALISGAMGKAGIASTDIKATAKASAAKPAENTRKAPAKQAAQTAVNGKAPRLNFATAEGKGAKKGTVVKPTRDEVKELGVRVVKGAKSKIISVLRIVKRDGVSTVVSAADGHAGLPFDLIYMNDGQPTYADTVTAAEYNKL